MNFKNYSFISSFILTLLICEGALAQGRSEIIERILRRSGGDSGEAFKNISKKSNAERMDLSRGILIPKNLTDKEIGNIGTAKIFHEIRKQRLAAEILGVDVGLAELERDFSLLQKKLSLEDRQVLASVFETEGYYFSGGFSQHIEELELPPTFRLNIGTGELIVQRRFRLWRTEITLGSINVYKVAAVLAGVSYCIVEENCSNVLRGLKDEEVQEFSDWLDEKILAAGESRELLEKMFEEESQLRE